MKKQLFGRSSPVPALEDGVNNQSFADDEEDQDIGTTTSTSSRDSNWMQSMLGVDQLRTINLESLKNIVAEEVTARVVKAFEGRLHAAESRAARAEAQVADAVEKLSLIQKKHESSLSSFATTRSNIMVAKQHPSEDFTENRETAMSADSYTLMMIREINSKSWLFAGLTFTTQVSLLGLIFKDQMSASSKSTPFNVPFSVDSSVRGAQFLAMMITIGTSYDVVIPIKDMSLLLYSNKEEWKKIVYQIPDNSSKDFSSNKSGNENDINWNRSEDTVVIEESWNDNHSGESHNNTDSQLTSKGNYGDRRLWVLHILFPNFIKFIEGILVVVVTFVIVIQSDNIIDLFKDFAAMQVIAELDNVAFWLANHGYFGNSLQKDTDDARRVKLKDQVPKLCYGLPLRPVILFSLFIVLSALLMIVVIGQVSGKYFFEKYPRCDINPNLIPEVGNGICNGGVLNTLECGFDGGDCINFNIAYPNCDVLHPFEVGDTVCQDQYNNDDCSWDGGDCCPFASDDPFLGDTVCHLSYNTKACDNDNGDCNQFLARFPNCKVVEYVNVKDNNGNPAVIGDGLCSFTAEYMTPECGYEDGDCIGCITDDPSRLGNGICDGGEYNTEQCGYDLGDCTRCNGIVKNVSFLGNGVCDGQEYNTEECGYDGGDCNGCLELGLTDLSELGNGKCDSSWPYNTKACAFDAGDCWELNEETTKKFPNCTEEEIGWIGNGICEPAVNVEECGWDGGDCVHINYPDCDAEDSSRISNGVCDNSPIYNNPECGWDGADCDVRNDEMKSKYPMCDWFLDVGHMGDGSCHNDLNYENCGFDDGDCQEFNKKYPGCQVYLTHLIGDGKCHDSEEFNNKECKWDGYDCINVTAIQIKYPDCTWSRIAELGDDHCDIEANIEECGWDAGDCFELNFPHCDVADLSMISDGVCDSNFTITNPHANMPDCNWDGGDCNARNEEIKLKYPDCYWSIHIGNAGDDYCDFELNSPECGYDHGDCEEFNMLYPWCESFEPGRVGDGFCDYGYDYSDNKECGWDGGDCIDDLTKTSLQNLYPNCTWLRIAEIGDGYCDMAANTAECGWDDGDCIVNNAFPHCNATYNETWLIGNNHCDDKYDTKDCGWDLGDCKNLTNVISQYPDCTWFRLAELGDGHCDNDLDVEECGYDGGDCMF